MLGARTTILGERLGPTQIGGIMSGEVGLGFAQQWRVDDVKPNPVENEDTERTTRKIATPPRVRIDPVFA